MNYAACLVVINHAGDHGIGAEDLNIIANRFRCRHIREFDFLPPGHLSIGKEGLQQRAEDILQDLVADNEFTLGKSTSTDHEVLLFLGHSFGGVLVKQIILSAMTQPRYEAVLDSTALLVFIGTPHKLELSLFPSPSLSLSQAIASQKKGEIDPINLIFDLQSTVPSLEDELPTMLGNKLAIVNFIGGSMTEERVGVPREETIRLACSYSELWTTVVTENTAVDTIIDTLTQAVEVKHKSLSTTHGDDISPEVLAASNGHVTVMMELLDRLARKRQIMDLPVTAGYLNSIPESHACLRIAARNGQIGALEKLLQTGVDATSPDPAGNTALHLAVKANQLVAVEKLLENASPEDKNVALAIAAQLGDMDIMHTLICNGAEVALTENDFACPSPLYPTAERSNETIMSELLEREVDTILNSPEALKTLLVATRDGDTRGYAEMILPIAAKRGYSKIIELLVEHGTDVNHNSVSGAAPLVLAAKGGHILTCRYLLDCAANVDGTDIDDTTALIIACRSGSTELATLLLEFNADINAVDSNGESPLFAAVDAPAIVRLLLSNNPKPDIDMPNDNGRTPLSQAAKKGNLESLNLLIEENADINATDNHGNSILHIAILDRHFNIVERLVEMGADCHAQNRIRRSPLHQAAAGGFHEALEFLIPKITDINVLSDDGTALAAVAEGSLGERDQEKFIRCAKTLLSNKADVNCRGDAQYSPLQAAAWHENEQLLKLYLKHGAIVDAKGGLLTTALNAAVSVCRADLVKILLEAGASPFVEIGNGQTVLSDAIESSNDDVLEALLNSHSQMIPQEAIHGALMKAAKVDNLSAFKSLLAKVALTEKAVKLPSILFEAINNYGHSVLYYLLGEGKHLVDLDETDIYGATALAYVIVLERGHVDEFLKAGANPNIADDRGNTPLTLAAKASNDDYVQALLSGRYGADKVAQADASDYAGRGALYWACYNKNESMFDIVLRSLIEQNAAQDAYHSAMHAASAQDMRTMLEQLINIGGIPTRPDRNNWTLMDTAKEYRAASVIELLSTQMDAEDQALRTVSDFKRPTSWNRADVHRKLEISGQGLRMEVKSPTWTSAGIGRTDFCVPTGILQYYFEVTIEKVVVHDRNIMPFARLMEFGVGFCHEHVTLNIMVGWDTGSWGYHLDDNRLFAGLEHGTRPQFYDEGYAEGDTIGCGLNLYDHTVFYTKNGTYVGRAFDDVRGKLYPAVSFGDLPSGTSILANFGGDPAIPFKYNKYNPTN